MDRSDLESSFSRVLRPGLDDVAGFALRFATAHEAAD
jgi:hypothetical protein